MILSTKPQALLDSLAKAKAVYVEEVVPGQQPSASHNPYRSGYEWLFVYERRLAKVLRPYMASFRHKVIGDGGLIGEGGLLCEALSNAFYYGHGKDPMLPLGVRVWVGESGFLVSIQDQGPGFNVSGVLRQFRQGGTYFHTAGNGLRTMTASKHFAVTYNARGTCWYLLYRFDEDYAMFGDASGPTTQTEASIHLVPPPEAIASLQAALLLPRDHAPASGFGLAPDIARELVALLTALQTDLADLGGRIGSRSTLHLSVEAADGCWLLDCTAFGAGTLACMPKPQTPLAVARATLPKLRRFFVEMEPHARD
jgi:hypothetical protein